MTHDEIGDFVAQRLNNKQGYKIAFSNVTSAHANELPDVIAFDWNGNTLLGEVKVSRADFRADLKKLHRANGSTIGNKRVYITPKGLLKVEEIPYGWMLWEVSKRKGGYILSVVKGKTKITKEYPRWNDPTKFEKKVITGLKNMNDQEYRHFNESSNYDAVNLLIRILSRIQSSGFDISKYARHQP